MSRLRDTWLVILGLALFSGVLMSISVRTVQDTQQYVHDTYATVVSSHTTVVWQATEVKRLITIYNATATALAK